MSNTLQILFDSIHDVSNRLSSKDELKIRYHVVALLRRPLPFSLQESVAQIVVGAHPAIAEAIDSPADGSDLPEAAISETRVKIKVGLTTPSDIQTVREKQVAEVVERSVIASARG